MTVKRCLLVLGIVAGLSTAAFVAREIEGPGLPMTVAAETLFRTLDAKQQKKAAFAFDDKERFRWYFTPQQDLKKRTALRNGVPLAEMTDRQKELTRLLLRTGTSESGYLKATVIMSLEAILADLEKNGRMVRDPSWYFLTFFGTPSKTGKWGWRLEGHHLSLNFTVEAGKVVSATPFFLGANPAVVKGGARKGTEALPEAVKPFRDLIALLDDEQKKVARQPKAFPEIEEAKPRASVGDPVGLAAAKMTDKQKAALWQLIEGYAVRMPIAVAAHELAAIKDAGLDKVTFAYGGGDGTAGKPYTYRIQGPTFVIEFLNEQADSAGNPANHIHSVYRSLRNDFGLTS
ncbi:MAG: DUF3500 domain-containing protein [Gemmataceae bacterium]